MKWTFILLAALAGCKGGADTGVRVTLIQSDDAAADAITVSYDAADGGGVALCCSVPRVLTGLEKYDPDYYSPYHNVMVNGTPQQQAYATCDQLSSWPGPTRPGANPTQAQIDLYMSEFMSGPNIAVVLPCLEPTSSAYGRWQCGGDAGQAAECMSSGWSCGEGSTCWFDPGATSGYGCTGTVTKCSFTLYTPPAALSDSGAG